MTDDTPRTTPTQHILAAGLALAGPTRIDGGGSFVVVPEGYAVRDIEKFLAAPARARGDIRCETPEAFIAYYNRFCDEAASLVFAHTEQFRLTGVLDWHRPETGPGERDGMSGRAGFGEHRVTYEAPRSDEWKIWTTANGAPMPQAKFSQFIEDNVKDIREPDGADVLEVARQLEVTKKVEFASAMRLSDGQREFTYNEQVEGSTRRSQLKVPEEFKLGIPVFIGGELYEVIARLRYRIDGGQLALWYDLASHDAVARDAFSRVVEQVAEGISTDLLMAAPSA